MSIPKTQVPLGKRHITKTKKLKKTQKTKQLAIMSLNKIPGLTTGAYFRFIVFFKSP
jgi:hypothetical protein